jgi:high-affinity Fe2+/Pb2+ permease
MEKPLSIVDSLFSFLRAFGLWLDLDFWELGIIVCFMVFSTILYRLHKTGDNAFRFEDFFKAAITGQPSLRRLAFFGAFLTSSWIVLHQEIFGKLTETIFGLYVGAWVVGYVAPAISEKFATNPAKPPEKGNTP